MKGQEKGQIGEAFDFVVEYINKKVKENMSYGPTDVVWLTACRMYNFSKNQVDGLTKWLPVLK